MSQGIKDRLLFKMAMELDPELTPLHGHPKSMAISEQFPPEEELRTD